MNIPQLTYPPFADHLGCFQIGAFINNAAMNTLYKSFGALRYTFVKGTQVGMELLSYVYASVHI